MREGSTHECLLNRSVQETLAKAIPPSRKGQDFKAR